MLYVGIIIIVWLFVFVVTTPVAPKVIRFFQKPTVTIAKSPPCRYCNGDSLILTYKKDYRNNPKCNKHQVQYEHIENMEHEFFGPPLTIKTESWHTSSYARQFHNSDVTQGYVDDENVYLKGAFRSTLERTMSFLANVGYTVHIREIDGRVYYEILNSVGHFAEIGILEDPTLGFKLPEGPKPKPLSQRNVSGVDEWTGEDADMARYLKERERR